MQIDIETAVTVLKTRVAEDAIIIGVLQQEIAARDAVIADLQAASPEVTRPAEPSTSPIPAP
jgi:hypothetical protein